MKALVLSIFCALAVGCATPQKGIQFGMFQVPQKNLGDAKALGMDFVFGPAQKEYLEEADRLGLKVITYKKAGGAGVMLTDEPDLHGIPPEKIAEEYKKAKGRRPIYLNLASGYSVEAYRDYCDVVMFDWFPVNWMPTETYYAHCRGARLAAGKKPFYTVVQTFNWAKYPKMMPPGEYRKPTAAEVKAMALWAAMNGASGITFYPLDDQHARLSDSPEIAAAIKEAVELIRNYDWFFELPRAWTEYPFSFPVKEDKTNSIAETSIAIRAGRTEEALFLMAANTTDREIVVKPMVKLDDVGELLTFAPYEVKFLSARSQ